MAIDIGEGNPAPDKAVGTAAYEAGQRALTEQRYADAAGQFETAYPLVDDDPGFLRSYADALIGMGGRRANVRRALDYLNVAAKLMLRIEFRKNRLICF